MEVASIDAAGRLLLGARHWRRLQEWAAGQPYSAAEALELVVNGVLEVRHDRVRWANPDTKPASSAGERPRYRSPSRAPRR